MSTKPPVLTDPALLEELTPRERDFVQHPLVTIDPIQAAREVGYSEVYSLDAGRHARRLLYYIQHYAKQRMAAAEISQQQILEELAAIAFADETQYFEAIDTPDGNTVRRVKDLARLPPAMRKALKNVNFEYVTQDGVAIPNVTSFELHDKVTALKALAKYFGLELGKTGPNPNASEPLQRAMLENLTDDELEKVNAIFTKAATRTKAAVDKRRDGNAISVDK